jgi:biopolymer transport protein TolR
MGLMAAHSDTVEDEDGITSINITPLVDVFLVLLILVMITSSLLDQGEIPVSVPTAAHAGEKAPKASGLAMDKEGRVYLDGFEADSATVIEALRSKVAQDSAHQVLIAADKSLLYGQVTRLLDWVRGAGVRKYALKVTRAE